MPCPASTLLRPLSLLPLFRQPFTLSPPSRSGHRKHGCVPGTHTTNFISCSQFAAPACAPVSRLTRPALPWFSAPAVPFPTIALTASVSTSPPHAVLSLSPPPEVDTSLRCSLGREETGDGASLSPAPTPQLYTLPKSPARGRRRRQWPSPPTPPPLLDSAAGSSAEWVGLAEAETGMGALAQWQLPLLSSLAVLHRASRVPEQKGHYGILLSREQTSYS